MAEDRLDQGPVRHVRALAREACGQQQALVVEHRHADADPVAGGQQIELVVQVHRHKGRDMEALATGLADALVGRGLDRQHIVVLLAEGVADGMDGRRQPPVAIVAEIDAQRIEAMAQQARHAQQGDPAAGQVKPRLREPRLDLRPDRGLETTGEVAIVERRQVPAIVRKQPQARSQIVDLVQVQGQHKDAIAQAVTPGPGAAMDDDPAVEPRPHATTRAWGSASAGGVMKMRLEGWGVSQGRCTPPSCSATASPACRPSSWKPDPK